MDTQYAGAFQKDLPQGHRRQKSKKCGKRQVPRLYELADKRSPSLRPRNVPFMEIQATTEEIIEEVEFIRGVAVKATHRAGNR